MISDFYKTTFTVSRSVWTTDGSGNPISAEAEQGTFSGHIQQAQAGSSAAALSEHLGLSFTKTYIIWCPVSTDVREGDTLSDGTNAYSVRGKQRNAVGTNQHLELVVELDEV